MIQQLAKREADGTGAEELLGSIRGFENSQGAILRADVGFVLYRSSDEVNELLSARHEGLGEQARGGEIENMETTHVCGQTVAQCLSPLLSLLLILSGRVACGVVDGKNKMSQERLRSYQTKPNHSDFIISRKPISAREKI